MAAFSRVADSGWPARLSRHLLLLSQSVLPRVFSRSARRARSARVNATIPARLEFPFILQNAAPLLSVSRHPLSWSSCGTTRFTPSSSTANLGLALAPSCWLLNVSPALHLHPFLPFAAPLRRRKAGLLFVRYLRQAAAFRVEGDLPCSTNATCCSPGSACSGSA